MLTSLYRKGLLGVADAAPVARFIQEQGLKLGANRFVAGEALTDGLAAVAKLEQQGLHGILDPLGEFVDNLEGVEQIMQGILQMLDTLGAQDLREKYVSVKPTQFGLAISRDLGHANAKRIAKKAQDLNIRICLDMENSPYVDDTLYIFKSLYEDGFHNISTVLQGYLYRTMADLQDLLTLSPKPFLRLVKGAYKESEDVAFQDKNDVDKNYREMIFTALEAGAPIGLASHDERMIGEVEAFLRGVQSHGVKSQGQDAPYVEFQLLYGVKLALQQRLLAAGHKVFIYVPYGPDWYGYFSRRLAERPANLLFIVRGLFS
jgi:proline dehydrogenase